MGRVDSYTVLLNKGSEWERSKEDLSNSTLSTLFQNLKPGVLYCVVVISKSGPLQSDNSTYCNATCELTHDGLKMICTLFSNHNK